METFTPLEIENLKELILSASLENVQLARDILSAEEGAWEKIAGELLGDLMIPLGKSLSLMDVYLVFQMTYLRISSDDRYIPESIGFLSQLETLRSSHCNLSSLPSSISKCKSISVIDLDYNCFEEIPAVLSNLPKLTRLEMRHNGTLTNFKNLKLLTNLNHLDIGWCRLTDLPPEIYEIESLTVIDISYNELLVLPDWLFRMPNLKKISFEGNYLPKEEVLRISDYIIENRLNIQVHGLSNQRTHELLPNKNKYPV